MYRNSIPLLLTEETWTLLTMRSINRFIIGTAYGRINPAPRQYREEAAKRKSRGLITPEPIDQDGTLWVSKNVVRDDTWRDAMSDTSKILLLTAGGFLFGLINGEVGKWVQEATESVVYGVVSMLLGMILGFAFLVYLIYRLDTHYRNGT